MSYIYVIELHVGARRACGAKLKNNIGACVCSLAEQSGLASELVVDINISHTALACVGILICGTGIGMSMCANKCNGIRAALCSDTYSAKMTRRHNNANVLCMGARVIGSCLAMDIVDAFLENEFEGGRHADRLALMEKIEASQKN